MKMHMVGGDTLVYNASVGYKARWAFTDREMELFCDNTCSAGVHIRTVQCTYLTDQLFPAVSSKGSLWSVTLSLSIPKPRLRHAYRFDKPILAMNASPKHAGASDVHIWTADFGKQNNGAERLIARKWMKFSSKQPTSCSKAHANAQMEWGCCYNIILSIRNVRLYCLQTSSTEDQARIFRLWVIIWCIEDLLCRA